MPRVQSVVDALHISRIEIREAEAPEIRKYMNEKVGPAETHPKRTLADDSALRNISSGWEKSSPTSEIAGRIS